MSDYEQELKTHQEASFITLHEKIKAVKDYINIFTDERQKYNKADYQKLVKNMDDALVECKEQCDAYITHLEKNVKMYREDIASGSS